MTARALETRQTRREIWRWRSTALMTSATQECRQR